MTNPKTEPRTAIEDRLRDRDDRPHTSWPRWTYRDYVNVNRIGEYLDSDVQPVFLAYRDRDGDNVFLIEGDWTAEELTEGLAGDAVDS